MQSTWDWAIPCWGKVAVARGKRGLGKVANVDWHEISAYAIKNETIRSGSKNSKICHLSSASRPSNPVKHLRQRQGATGDTWSGNIAPRMADGSSSRGPHPARPGYMCCRACTAESTAPRSTVRFKLIPEGPCAKAGARYEGAPPVHGPHANSRWLCDSHQRAAQRSSSRGEAVIVDPIPPSALPADRFCAVCARLLVNQRGGSEYEQVADVCCEVMCAHCAGEKFVSCLQQGMHCGACNKKVVSWTVRAPQGGTGRRVQANVEALGVWTMNRNGGSVAYFIMDGERRLKVEGGRRSLRDLACSGRKTRSNGDWAKIVRAEQAWFLLRQSGKASDLGCDRLRFYARLSEDDELVFSSVRTLVVYKRTQAPAKHHNEAGFVLDLCQVRAARFVDDLTDNWGQEYVESRDTCDGVSVPDKSLVVLSGPFRHIVNTEPTITACIAPSNHHSGGGPYFCTLADVREGLSKFGLPDLP